MRLISSERALKTRRLLLEPLTEAHAADLHEPLLLRAFSDEYRYELGRP